MAKRRTDIYCDANRLILRMFPGDNLHKLTRLYDLPEDKAAEFRRELSRVEHTLAHKYGVGLDTVRSQTAEIIRQLRTNMRGS